jgi:hypothetical protein
MSTNTVTLQGSFISTGANYFVPLRSGVNWMKTFNTSLLASPANGDCLIAEWYAPMPSGAGVFWDYDSSATSTNPSYETTGGFYLTDTTLTAAGTINATITAVSTASIPVVTNSGTNGLAAGNIVRIYNVAGAQQLGGIDFTVGYNTLSGTTFSLDYMAQLGAAGTTGSWALISYDPIFYPRRRYITKISQASQAVVTLSVTHGYQVGQIVRFVVPAVYGMTQMNGLQGTITAINTATTNGNTITVNINSSAFNAFAFPVSATVPFSPAEVVPVGEDTAYAESQNVNILSDATLNTAQIGMTLGGGVAGPAGANGNVIVWQAGTCFSVSDLANL